MCVCVCVCVCVYLQHPPHDTRSIFKAKFNRFEFRVFLLLDQLPLQS